MKLQARLIGSVHRVLQLNIDIMCANNPQAKRCLERANLTLPSCEEATTPGVGTRKFHCGSLPGHDGGRLVTLRGSPPFTNDTASRTQALALLQTLNADLLSHPSATLTLERWCGDHGLAPEAKIVAHRVRGDDKPLPQNARHALGISADEPMHYRRVQLACGELVLSEADNWYVPLAPHLR